MRGNGASQSHNIFIHHNGEQLHLLQQKPIISVRERPRSHWRHWLDRRLSDPPVVAEHRFEVRLERRHNPMQPFDVETDRPTVGENRTSS
ncbi:MAG: hypothetical protein Kow00106_26720 [Anaerolineae bacterium]